MRLTPSHLIHNPPHARLARGKFGRGNPPMRICIWRVGRGTVTHPPSTAVIWRTRAHHVEELDYYYPSNPRTERQQSWRSVFAHAVRNWQTMTADERASNHISHTHAHEYPPLSDYHYSIQQFLLAHTEQ